MQDAWEELHQNGHVKFETILKKYDGSDFFAHIESHIIEVDGETLVHGTIRNISKERENELILKRASNIFDSIKDGVMVTDNSGVITEINDAFTTISGYSEEDIIGQKPAVLKSGFHDKEYYTQMWESIQNNDTWSNKIINKKKNGQKYVSFLTISAIKDSCGNIVNFIGLFSDITKLLEYENQIKEKDILLIQQSKMAMMGEMIDNIAHQWKQPLNMISVLSSELLIENEMNKFDINKMVKNLDETMSTVHYLAQTIDDFRSFFKPNKETSTFTSESLIKRLLLLTKSRVKSIGINIIENMENIEINTLENELIQVLINIFNNACDALKQSNNHEHLILISVNKHQSHISICIKDNAGGIPEDIIDNIFEARFTTKESTGGSGVGLYMSKNIIESLNGTINVSNEKYTYEDIQYDGANFEVIIPN